MNEENANLRNRVNALEEEKRNQPQPVASSTSESNKLPDAPEYTAFFDINKAYLSQKEAVNLEAYANLIKNILKINSLLQDMLINKQVQLNTMNA